jgi:thiol:disulfide interchange protein DsbC
MFNKLIVGLFALLCGFSSTSFALSADVEKTLKEKFSKLPGLEISQVKTTPINGLVEVITSQGLFYASEDGKYLIQGTLFSLADNIVNLTEKSLTAVRLEGIKTLEKNMIVYPAKNEQHVITVFTDISCGYCRKLHSQINEYNEKGITVRYLAYPRSGINDALGQPTKVFRDMRSIWCSENPKAMLDKAFNGESLPYRVCDTPIEAEYNFGRQIGVSGTPAIVVENGIMIPGYRGPDDMLKVLKSIKSQ